jgi:hypothetical protein
MKKRTSMQLGYWEGDGTATVSFDTMGYDRSGNELGMLRTEQHYASAPYGTTYTRAMGVNGWGSIGDIIVPRPILKATDAHTGWPDPVGFWGGRNLYRYCRNNPVMRSDPFGLDDDDMPLKLPEKGDNENVPTVEPVIVPGEDPNPADISRTGFLPGDLGWPGIPFDLEPFIDAQLHGVREKPAIELKPPDSPSVEHPPPSSVPPQNPPQPVSAPAPASPSSPSAPAAGVFSLWQVMLITAFNDPVGDRDNRLGPGSIATADLRYRTSDFDQHGNLVHFRPGSPIRAYRRGSAVTIYRQDGSVYNGGITDTGAGFAAPRPQMGLPNGVPGTLWLDMWTPTGSEDPEWDLVLIQLQP